MGWKEERGILMRLKMNDPKRKRDDRKLEGNGGLADLSDEDT